MANRRALYPLLWRASSTSFSSSTSAPTSESVFKLTSRHFEQQRKNFGLPFPILRQCACFLPNAGFQRSLDFQSRFYGSTSTLIQRSPSFSELNSDDVGYFKSILGENNVIQDEDRLQPANTDWMHKYRGSSKLLLLPRTTEEVILPSNIFYFYGNRRILKPG